MKKNYKNKYNIIDTSLDDYYINPYQYIYKNTYTPIYKTSDSTELANIINDLTNIVIENNKIKLSTKKDNFNPIIFKHIANNNIESLQNLLKNDKNINVNQQDKDGDTPLHISIFLANTLITKLLLDNNADPLIIDKWGQTPLHRICFCMGNDNTLEIIDIFIKKDKIDNLDLFNVQDNNGNTTFHLVLKHIIKKKTILNNSHKLIIAKLKKLTNSKLKNLDGQSIQELLKLINF